MFYSISDIYERASLQKISSFLLDGEEDSRELSGKYDKDLEKAEQKMNDALGKYFKDEKLIGDIMEDIFCFTNMYERIYMEVGLKCGLLLAKDLIIPND